MARRKLKRRISWQLPQQENDTDTLDLDDNIENNDDSNCMMLDHDNTTQNEYDNDMNACHNNDRTQTSDITTSNETLSNDSTLNKSLSGTNIIFELNSLNFIFPCFSKKYSIK